MLHFKVIAASLATSIVLLLSSCSSREKVDLVIRNATIYTADSVFSVAEAMAIANGKILSTGSNDFILSKFEGLEEIDAEGKFIYPGFIDAHCHFTGYATDMWKCNLTGTKSFAEILGRVVEYSKDAPSEWLYGRGWDQNDWEVKTYPDKKVLDSLFPTRPVFLKRIDGHAALVNQAALDFAGITDTTVITGGRFEKVNGKLTGLLIDKAMEMVDSKIPHIADSVATRFFSRAQEICFGLGLTGVQDCGISEHTLDLLIQHEKQGNLKMKVFALLSDSLPYYDRWIKKGVFKSPLITMGGFKLYGDGALGSRGACLIEPYADMPGWNGFLLSDPGYFQMIAQKLAQSDFQMCTHAIGDSANRHILKTYAEVLKGKNDRRWRIEHAQVVNEKDFHFFSDYSVIPSVQPTHATSDMYWAETRLGAHRMKGAYSYQTLLQKNGWLPLGTDFPVEGINPLNTFYAAVARKDTAGFPQHGFIAEQKLSRQDALRGITIWAAKAGFMEKSQGSLEAGKSADFIILSGDLLKVPEEKILQTRILATFSNGKNVYKAGN